MGVSPESFRPYGWLSRRMSLSREDEPTKSRPKTGRSKPTNLVEPETGEFEFRLEDPVTMLPADELFSNGKLLPLHFSSLKQQQQQPPLSDTRFLETAKSCPEMDPYLFSPRAPRCSSGWRELLGLKKSSQNTNQQQHPMPESRSPKSLKHLLNRTTKYLPSLNLPLLKDSDSEAISISSSRLSLSSSSSSVHEHEDLPRLSLDSDKPSPNPFAPCRSINPNPNPPRTGRSRIRRDPSTNRGNFSVDSPRMNSSGKIVFESLERSSSSPSSFNGGPQFKQRGIERSYSANVRITPVLNVPVCSLRGSSKSGLVFGLFSSSRQKAANGGSNSKGRQCNSRS
ncbi:S-adenosyl-L-methionine-dependent methyltransferases superfamily protein, putative isoform 1 [Hibiscus syriacus]|uniref:S-adenosyl-L-methionine-dependent methyltransferases superfamily protein, putative isoform 1 n=2 Tax=Hibiscus syriacus TaxID=106335 RepID=A0A6A2Y4S8_HIBSY|nr:S-adenosyl-L-methionine-dependent methyltransferases superfamily protein, putative isoform 1 [Hibiscus syriacus]